MLESHPEMRTSTFEENGIVVQLHSGIYFLFLEVVEHKTDLFELSIHRTGIYHDERN